MAARRAPVGLAVGGRKLWIDVTDDHELDTLQQITLLEACRAKDRLDKLDEVLRGDADTWVSLVHRLQTADYEVKVDQALSAANSTANLLKQLLAALRLPDEQSGKRPQQRGGARGAYKPTAASRPPAKVSSMEALRRRSESA